MSHIVPAAAQLIQQVTGITRSVKAKAVDRPDERGWHRIIEFDPATSQWLLPTLDLIGDERIEKLDPAGRTVTFVADTRAGDRTHYPLATALDVLRKAE